MIAVVVGSGVLTVVLLVLGFETAGGLLALVQLGGLIGAPLALVLNRRLRSIPVVVALSFGLSLALSALSVQSLIWFGTATGELLVVTGTAYGCLVAALVGQPDEDVDVL